MRCSQLNFFCLKELSVTRFCRSVKEKSSNAVITGESFPNKTVSILNGEKTESFSHEENHLIDLNNARFALAI